MELNQRLGLLSGKLNLVVNNEDVLVIKHTKVMNSSNSKYLLDVIDPRYESYKRFSVSSAIVAIACLIASAYLWWYGKSHFQPPDDGAYLVFSVMFFIISLIAGIKAYKSMVNLVVFFSHDGRRLFSILGNKPNENVVNEFCEYLAKRIEGIRYNGEISADRMAEILIKHVEFLQEHNILNDAEVKTAIERIANKSKSKVVSLVKNNEN